jgi:hypothetical protein
MSLEMVAPRNYTLRTKSGHTIKFLADQPKLVPDDIVQEALAVNILPTDNKALTTRDDSAAGVQKVQIGGLLRSALVIRAIADIARENDAANFDGGGRPKTNVLNDRCGLGLSAKERSDYWDQYRQLKANGEDLPTHKSLDMVLAVQSLNTPSDFKEYAALLEVPSEKLAGLSLREQKQILLAAATK